MQTPVATFEFRLKWVFEYHTVSGSYISSNDEHGYMQIILKQTKQKRL